MQGEREREWGKGDEVWKIMAATNNSAQSNELYDILVTMFCLGENILTLTQ